MQQMDTSIAPPVVTKKHWKAAGIIVLVLVSTAVGFLLRGGGEPVSSQGAAASADGEQLSVSTDESTWPAYGTVYQTATVYKTEGRDYDTSGIMTALSSGGFDCSVTTSRDLTEESRFGMTYWGACLVNGASVDVHLFRGPVGRLAFFNHLKSSKVVVVFGGSSWAVHANSREEALDVIGALGGGQIVYG